MVVIYLEALSSVMSLYGVYLLSERVYLKGWVINGLGDLLWIYYGVLTNQWSLAILQTVLFILCVNGYRNNKKGKSHNDNRV